jgi:hypothetical protein
MDSVEALSKRLLPTLDVDFLQGEDFKSKYYFSYLILSCAASVVRCVMPTDSITC